MTSESDADQDLLRRIPRASRRPSRNCFAASADTAPDGPAPVGQAVAGRIDPSDVIQEALSLSTAQQLPEFTADPAVPHFPLAPPPDGPAVDHAAPD